MSAPPVKIPCGRPWTWAFIQNLGLPGLIHNPCISQLFNVPLQLCCLCRSLHWVTDPQFRTISYDLKCESFDFGPADVKPVKSNNEFCLDRTYQVSTEYECHTKLGVKTCFHDVLVPVVSCGSTLNENIMITRSVLIRQEMKSVNSNI